MTTAVREPYDVWATHAERDERDLRDTLRFDGYEALLPVTWHGGALSPAQRCEPYWNPVENKWEF